MTALAADKLQEAVFSQLKADETLLNKLTGVFDQVPEATQFPYLTFGDTSVSPASLKDCFGSKVNFNISLWSDEQSQMQVKELMADVDAILNRANLQIFGYDLMSLQLVSADVIRQFSEAGALYRGRLTYSALVYQ